MDKMDYWGKIDKNARFELDFERPEQKRLAGKILLIGGHVKAFFSVARATQVANERGVGEVLTVLPNSLEKKIPKTNGIKYLASESAGGFSKDTREELTELMRGMDASLILGDMGKNSEVKELISGLLTEKCEHPTLLMRDAVDLALESEHFEVWIQNRNAEVFVTISQLKKMLQTIYYPRVLNLTAPLIQVVEILHKLTLSYDVTIVTMQSEQILLAQGGKVLSVALGETKYNPLTLFDGELAINMTRLQLWNRETGKDLEAMAAACLDK